MKQSTSYNEMAEHLRHLFKSIPYSNTTYKDMDFILNSFADFMQIHSLTEYTPEIGEQMIAYCKNDLHVCDSRVSRARGVVRKLNNLYEGLDGTDALWPSGIVKIPLPNDLKQSLDNYLAESRANGNKETTIYMKKWVLDRFLKNLADLGCSTCSDITAERIQKAFLKMNYIGYWQRIGKYLRFLFEKSYLSHDYSRLVTHCKDYPPQPSVYTVDEITRIEKSVDRSKPYGKRDYAVLLLMTRYGIRARDIAALKFNNVDFENNRIHFIQMKTGDPWECELFPEVKEALKDYINHVRPKDAYSSFIFYSAVIPHRPISRRAVDVMIENVIKNSGIDFKGRRHGGRALRSSIASNLVNNGVSTEVVRRVLGHGTKYAIKSYARIDMTNLRLCPIPVPAPTGEYKSFLSWKEKEGEH